MMDNFQKDTYQNTGYRNERNNINIVTLDSKSVSSAARASDFEHNTVYYELLEPLHIDSSTDVFLEYIHFQDIDIGGTTDLEGTPYFCIDIPELDIKTYSNNNSLSDKFVIPNDTFGKTDQNQNDNDADVETYHIRLKSNFISTIQPKTIHGFHISVTGLVPNADIGVTDIDTIVSDGTHYTADFNNYYLANTDPGGSVFSTCGAIKLSLLFKKREKLNKQVLKLQDGSYNDNDTLYKNTQYFNDRSIYQVLILDSIMSVDTSIGNSATKNSRQQYFNFNNIRFELLEPLRIDTKCEMYLEFFSLNNQQLFYAPSSGTTGVTHLETSSAFYLDIPELNLKTFTNDPYASDKYVIPNEIYGKTDKNQNDAPTNVSTYHIKLKRNFIGILEPTTLERITMSITGDNFANHATNKYYVGNQYDTTASTSSSVQVALLFKKICD